jgi:hypothetical protein
VSAGLFSKRNYKTVQSIQLSLPALVTEGESTATGNEYIDGVPNPYSSLTFRPSTYYASRHGLYDTCINKGPLATRGWVYQERLLAPRVLNFSKQLAWECSKELLCESVPDRVPAEYIWNYHNAKRAGNLDNWMDIVQQYTKLQLTFQSDRLIAISGIAQQRQETHGDVYLAGLWRKDLVQQLLWRPKSLTGQRLGISNSVMGRDYVAPSWSWASFNGPVWYDDNVERAVQYPLDILHTEVTLESPNAFVNVVRGKSAFVLDILYPLSRQLYRKVS